MAGFLALFLCLYTLWNLRQINKLRKTFFAGRLDANLEDLLYALGNEIKDLKKRQTVLEQSLTHLEDAFNFAIQKVGVVRFNPFADGGGNFSFCIALLDAQSTGVVITSMHGREQNRIYTKKIENGKSETQLTGEEQQAVVIANKNKSSKRVA